MGLDVAVVANVVAECRDDGIVALLDFCSREGTRLRGQVADFLCARCGGGWVVCDGGLRGPVASCDSVDDFFSENAVIETEGCWREVEVTLCWWIVRSFAWGPLDVGEWRGGDTKGDVAEVVV